MLDLELNQYLAFFIWIEKRKKKKDTSFSESQL